MTYLRELASHFDEILISLEQQGDVDLTKHHRVFESISLESRLNPGRPLLLQVQLGLHWLQSKLREVNVAGEEGHRLLLALEENVVDLPTFRFAGVCEVLVQST